MNGGVHPGSPNRGPDPASEPAQTFRSIADDARHLAAKLWRVTADTEGHNLTVVFSAGNHAPPFWTYGAPTSSADPIPLRWRF